MLLVYLWVLVARSFMAAPPSDDEIDAFWAEAARTVEEGDYEGYAALYHDDAVLVNGITGETYPIAEALAQWKQGFDDTRAGRMKASVQFRFTQRLHGATTAHETGIFRYDGHVEGEAAAPVYVYFEALMVRKAGAWKWVMEYQKALATEAAWEAAGR